MSPYFHYNGIQFKLLSVIIKIIKLYYNIFNIGFLWYNVHVYFKYFCILEISSMRRNVKMLLVIEILGIMTMCTVMFVLIWGFIIIKQILSQLKYKNYLLEKLTQYVHMITKK